jgi:hypothetical protein
LPGFDRQGPHPGMLAVKLDGATKETFYVWGLRVGFITYGAVCQDGKAAALFDCPRA